MTNEQIIEEFMYPIVLYVVHVEYLDGTHQYFTFEFEEDQQSFVEYVSEYMVELGILTAHFAESILNSDPRSDKQLYIEH